MATSKLTNLAALNAATAILRGETTDIDRDALIAKLEHMAAQTAKTRRTTKTGPTKAQLLNTRCMDELVSRMTAGAEYGTPELRDLIDRDMIQTYAIPFNSNGVVSPQKITALMGAAIKAGKVVRVDCKGAAKYTLA